MGYYRGLIPRVTWLPVMGQNFGYDRFSLACNIPATPGLAIVTSDSYLGS
jgi:hypothetical protein